MRVRLPFAASPHTAPAALAASATSSSRLGRELPALATSCADAGAALDFAARWTRNGFAKPVLARAGALETRWAAQLQVALGVLSLPAPTRKPWRGAAAAAWAALRGDGALLAECRSAQQSLRSRYERALDAGGPAELAELLATHYDDLIELDQRLAAL